MASILLFAFIAITVATLIDPHPYFGEDPLRVLTQLGYSQLVSDIRFNKTFRDSVINPITEIKFKGRKKPKIETRLNMDDYPFWENLRESYVTYNVTTQDGSKKVKFVLTVQFLFKSDHRCFNFCNLEDREQCLDCLVYN